MRPAELYPLLIRLMIARRLCGRHAPDIDTAPGRSDAVTAGKSGYYLASGVGPDLEDEFLAGSTHQTGRDMEKSEC